MVALADKSRLARAVLCLETGEVLGAIAPVKLSVPWVQEISELNSYILQTTGVEGFVLRLLEVQENSESEFVATYLVEVAKAPNSDLLLDYSGELDEHPFRIHYAKPGATRKLMNWVTAQLALIDAEISEAPVQVRTWNLSAIWRFETTKGQFWLKALPPYFAHEGFVLRMLEQEKVPSVLAAMEDRVLMYDVPGEDHYNGPFHLVKPMVSRLVEIQLSYRDQLPDLLKLGVPDWRGDWFVEQGRRVIQLYSGFLDKNEREVLSDFSGCLDQELAALHACGFPEVFIHGDFHQGNWRGTEEDLYILDWADVGVAHPLLEPPIPVHHYTSEQVSELLEHWKSCWQTAWPSANFDLAFEISRPLLTLRIAVLFQRFLDQIEPSEHVYHVADPLQFLKQTAQLWGESRRSA